MTLVARPACCVKSECLEGEVELELEFKPTFDYARAHTRSRVAHRWVRSPTAAPAT